MTEDVGETQKGSLPPDDPSVAAGPKRSRRPRSTSVKASGKVPPYAPGVNAIVAVDGANAAAAPVIPRKLLPVSLPGVEATSNTLRAVILNLSFFLAFFIILPAFATQLWKNQVVIEPISVPASLADLGMTSDVVANRVWDGLQDLVREAQTAKATIVAVPQGQHFDFALPQSGISIASVMSQLRDFLNLYETQISGEFICATTACSPDGLRLRLRVIKGSAVVIDLPEMGQSSMRDYFHMAAEGVFNELDPFVSIAALAKTQPNRAIVLARQLVRERAADAKWAHNLIGELDMNQGLYDEAKAEFDAALMSDPHFFEAEVNLGLALAHLGQFDTANAAIKAADQRNPSRVEVAKAFASLASMRGDKPAAVTWLLRASDLEPLEPKHLVLAAQTEIDLGRKADAETHLKAALAIAPGDAGALETLGNLYFGKYGDPPDYAAAVVIYRNWAQYDPQNTEAWFSLGNALLSNREYQASLDAYDQAMQLGQNDDRIHVVRAGDLMGLALAGQRPFTDAIEAFEQLRNAAPPIPTVFLSLGKLYAKVNKQAEAIAAYQRFLELVPADNQLRANVGSEIARLRGVETPLPLAAPVAN